MRPAAVLVALLAAALLVWPAAAPASSANGATPAARGDAGTLSMLLNTRCLVTQSGAVRCWGYNVNGELGFAPAGNQYWGDAPGETPQAVNLGLGVTAQAVAVGSYASCALSDIGEVLCWGPWTPGEVRQIDLGTGNAAKAISVGTDHGCAVLTTGGVRCWGANAYGQLAQGTTSSPGATTSVPVDLGPGRTAVAVDAGYQASCAILDTGALRCWGRNQFGQLAQGNIDTIGDDPSETTVGVDLGPGRTATAIVSGATSCAILDTGALRCWGVNNFGQLAQGNTDWIGDDPGETTVPVDLGGAKAMSVATDGNGVCAVLEGGGLRCWGRSHLGAALQGDTNDIGDTTGETTVPVNLGAGRTALAVAVAKGTVCLVDQARTLRCWGSGAYGGRASQDSSNYGTAPSETSAAAIAPVGLGELAVRDWDGDGVRDSADGCRLVAAATATGCPAPPPPAPPQNPDSTPPPASDPAPPATDQTPPRQSTPPPARTTEDDEDEPVRLRIRATLRAKTTRCGTDATATVRIGRRTLREDLDVRRVGRTRCAVSGTLTIPASLDAPDEVAVTITGRHLRTRTITLD